jgi:hypothetical protein
MSCLNIGGGLFLGAGGFGEVYSIEIRGRIRAIKTGTLGPLEATIAACGSKCIPKYIYSDEKSLYTAYLPISKVLLQSYHQKLI